MKLKTPSRRGWLFALVTGLIVIVLPYVLPRGAHHGWWDAIPGWWALYGAGGCAAIVLVSKWLGHTFLQKDEDWYE